MRCEPRGGRGKKIPPIKGATRRFTAEFLLVDLAHLDRLFLIEYVSKNAVVGCQEKVPITLDGNGPPDTTDTRIDHHDVDGAFRKFTIAGLENIAGFVNLVWSDLVRKIDDRRMGVDGENHPLHARHEPIAVAEIRQESDERARRRHLTIPRT